MDKPPVKTDIRTHGGRVRTGKRRKNGRQPGVSNTRKTRVDELRASSQGPPSETTGQAARPEAEYALQPTDGAQPLRGRSFSRRIMTRIFKVLGAFEIRPTP